MGPTFNLLTAAFMVAQQQNYVVVPASAAPAQQPPAQMQVIPNQVQMVPGAQMVPSTQTVVQGAPQAPCACAANKGQVIIQETQAPPAPAKSSGGFRLFGSRTAQPTQQVVEEAPQGDRPILSGLKRLFGSSSAKKEAAPMQETMIMQQQPQQVPAVTTSYPRKMPVGEPMTMPIPPAQLAPASGPQTSIAPISHTVPVAAPAARYEINSKLANKVGHEDDYSWITGQLQISQDGTYTIHYAPEGSLDKYQGRLSLNANGTDMRRFRDGDLISVRGGLVSQAGYATVYRANGIDLLERP